jgi:hypothetical protein
MNPVNTLNTLTKIPAEDKSKIPSLFIVTSITNLHPTALLSVPGKIQEKLLLVASSGDSPREMPSLRKAWQFHQSGAHFTGVCHT